MAVKIVAEPVFADAVCVEIAVKMELTAVVVAVGVMGASTPFVMYPIVATRPSFKVLADLLPQRPLNPQQNVPPDVEHSKPRDLLSYRKTLDKMMQFLLTN